MMNRLAIALGLIAGGLLLSGSVYACAGCGCCAAKVDEAGVRAISAEKLQKLQAGKGDLVVVDVLGAKSYVKNHIKGAINIPRSKVTEVAKEGKVLKKDQQIVLYCASKSCKASTKAAEDLVELGYTNVYDYEGGIAEWTEAGLPTQAGKLCGCGAAKGSPVCCK